MMANKKSILANLSKKPKMKKKKKNINQVIAEAKG